ncbi:Copia protease [Ceratocystis lukuohia]|uniref:Copia protease n=1 Tax=Ceratocystis lukuohia TaxID=2019550 RepID=A0ABR4MFY0_9PEZI
MTVKTKCYVQEAGILPCTRILLVVVRYSKGKPAGKPAGQAAGGGGKGGAPRGDNTDRDIICRHCKKKGHRQAHTTDGAAPAEAGGQGQMLMAVSKGPLQVDNNTWYVAPAVKVSVQKEVGTDVLPASTRTLPVDKVNTLMFTACVEDDDAEPGAAELIHTVFQQEESVVAGDMERSVTDCGVEKVTWADGQALALKVLNHESSGHAYTVKGHNMRNEWLFDTGSTLHICNDLKWFVPGTLAPVGAKGGSITTGGGVVRFLLRGTVAVQLLCRDGTFADIRLTNVALVPQFDINIISGLDFYRKGGSIDKKGLVDRHGKHMAKLDVHERGFYLYLNGVPWPAEPSGKINTEARDVLVKMNVIQKEGDTTFVTVNELQLSRLLHQRLGHPHFEALKKTIEASEGSLIPVKKLVDPDNPCISWRIYAGSFSYKGDCNRCITDQLKWYRNQTGGQLKRITVDNGTYVNIQELTVFVRSVGADIRTSPTYSPAQNGRSERTVKAMLVRMRTLMIHRNIPLALWPEIAKSVAYLHNVVVSVETGMSPLARWHVALHATPYLHDIGHLRTLGSRCVVRIPDAKLLQLRTSKLQAKGEEGILVGYSGHHLYRVWVKERKQVVTSNSLHIFEDLSNDDVDVMRSWPKGVWPESTNKGGASAELTTLGDVSGMQDFSPVENSERRGRPPKARPLLPMTHDEVLAIIDHDSEEAELASWMTDYADHVKTLIPHVFPTLKAAMDGREAGAWQDAIAVEIDQLIQMDVLAFVEQLPKGKRAIDLKWVLQRKLGAQLEEVKKKARLVARGFMQRLGLDYAETKAFTSGADSWRMLLALAVLMDWVLRQLDIVAAFLYGILKEDIYARQPPCRQEEERDS